MKQQRRKATTVVLMLTMIVSMFQSFVLRETYQGATSYTNAKEFYESTALLGENYHAEMVNGTIYYATCAKLASSSSNLKYVTLGFDVKLSGNGESVSFAVQRTGGSMVEIVKEKSGGYEYILYAIETDTIFKLAEATDTDDAETVFESSVLKITMDAIMTTKSGSDVDGSIEEDGKGGLDEDGTVYHLKHGNDLKAIMDIFSGHDFESYYNIEKDLENYKLSIRYAVEGTDPLACSTNAKVDSDYKLKDVTNGDTTTYSVLHEGSTPYTSSARIFEEMELLLPDDIDLKKKGYHLDEGSEWVTSGGRELDAATAYMPKSIVSGVGYGNKNIYLYANWKPNTYTIHYDNNGGIGFIPNSTHSFDREKELRNNTFIKFGYTLVPGAEWNTKPDGSGTSYAAGEEVVNLSSKDGDTITLYANWQEGVYTIDTNKEGGMGGTDHFFEKYDIDWFLDADLSQETDSISIPQKTGYTFEGYSKYFFGIGKEIVNKTGAIQVKPDYYERNSTIYANYTAKDYTITFDKQGGSGGTDSIRVTFDQMLPVANAPIRNGYTFKGYFTQINGQGICYYNEFMASEMRYQMDSDLTLYAYWKDETPPVTELIISTSDWTNAPLGIEVRAKATDVGTGLKKIELYCNGVKVAEQPNLNGAQQVIIPSATTPWFHTTEAIFQYKVVAYDMEGNVSESYGVVKYDITAPTGTYSIANDDKTNFSITIDATDYKIQ